MPTTPLPSMQEVIFNFLQASFAGLGKIPPPNTDDLDALASMLEGAEWLDAADVHSWPTRLQAALKEVLTELMLRLLLSEGTDAPGSGGGSSTTRLDEKATAAIAFAAKTIRDQWHKAGRASPA